MRHHHNGHRNAPSIDGKIRALCCSWVCVSRLWQLLRLKLAVKCWTRRADRFAINDVKVLCDSNIFSFVHSTRSLLVGESWLIFRVFVNWQTLFLMPLQKKKHKVEKREIEIENMTIWTIDDDDRISSVNTRLTEKCGMNEYTCFQQNADHYWRNLYKNAHSCIFCADNLQAL